MKKTLVKILTCFFCIAITLIALVVPSFADDDSGYDYAYQNGYEEGYQKGLEEGYDNGWNEGWYRGEDTGYLNGYNAAKNTWYQKGYQEGFSAGQTDTLNGTSTFKDMIFSIFEAPINLINGMLDFDLFGINVAGLVKTVITLAVVTLIVFGILKFVKG